MSTVFEPRWASAPGSTIMEALETRGLSAEDLADALSLSDPDTRRLILGEIEIDPGIATGLSATVGGSAAFWLERERNFRDSTQWLAADVLAQSLPIPYMRSMGWISPALSWKDSASKGLEYFGVHSAQEWDDTYGALLRRANYRTSAAFDSSGPALAAWLRQSAVVADSRPPLGAWSTSGLTSALPLLRGLTRLADPEQFIPRLVATCASFGVALTVIPAPPECVVSGATFASPDGRRVVALSGRFRSDDHFFFTLFHELGHLVLHSDDLFVDEFDENETSDVEAEADRFASDALIPFGVAGLAAHAGGPTMREVVAFAAAGSIAPGVVVGQLQHAGVLRFNQLNKLKRRYRWDGSTLKSARRG